mmetsp:Transcript_70169/g.116567  ORF Transcript_70169/g.116567 Transcript_70169/m.116567 type:complete len:202 (-) Transcript_70169:431-1036(-)|eukprot:CAMPEP_0119321866 /NCGR_PEP_ID=MMETSP1333-20130426/56651_1 /TAXON_ID=418940 /ORGANISM="Scyphosphaera apsteinii, Strain RCC1455" /LENGTH=201 /DNA_ID=CAMNT_0007328947 /DNA_START=18 /DNA_END=623 /DNA_ORIENTATION=-
MSGIDLLALLNGNVRPIIIALIILTICCCLIRPIKPATSQAQQSEVACMNNNGRAKQQSAVSISTCGVLLNFHGGVPVLISDAIDALFTLATRAEVYLITQLDNDSDAQEDAVLAALEAAGVFGTGRCDRRRTIFCTTEDGRCAICRQLAPSTHVDTSSKVTQYLGPHIPKVVLVSAAGASSSGGDRAVSVVPNFAEFVRS